MTRFIRRSRPVFHGWWILVGSMGVQGMQSLLFFQAFGVYAPFWMAEFGWSRTTISLIHSLHRTESGLLGPAHGWLLQRFKPRRVMVGGMLLIGCGFVVLGFVHNFAQFIAVFLLMSVGSSLCGFMTQMTMIVNWFERRRSRAMAMVGLGMSVGALLIPLLAWLLVNYGWRPVAIGSGLLFLLATWPVSRVMVSEPEEMGLRPDGEEAPSGGDAIDPAAAAGEAAQKGSMVRNVLRSKEFWLISIGHSNALAIVGAVTVHFVIFARETIGLSVTSAATLLTLITVCQIVGQAIGGFAGDRYDKRWLAAGGMFIHAVAMTLLTVARSSEFVVIAAVLHGVAWGLRGPLMGAMRADYFGRRAFAMVMGYSSVVLMVGAVLGPLVVGLLADRTGEYGLAFGVLAVIGILGVAAFMLLPPAPQET